MSIHKVTQESVFIFLIILVSIIIIPISVFTFSKIQQEKYTSQTTSPTDIQETSPTSQLDAKQKILLSLPPGESGILDETQDYRIEYVHAADLIQIEIFVSDVDHAKTEATNWFLKRGLQHQEVCSLPILFYPSFDIKNELKEKNITFTPLPPGC
jgi:hypothetical protein